MTGSYPIAWTIWASPSIPGPPGKTTRGGGGKTWWLGAGRYLLRELMRGFEPAPGGTHNLDRGLVGNAGVSRFDEGTKPSVDINARGRRS